MSFLPIAGRLVVMTTMFALVAYTAHAKKPEKDADILGTWTLTKVLDSADIASLTDQQAAALVGKVMVVRRDSVMFNGELCRGPELTRRRHDTAKYVRDGYHARVGSLGLPDIVMVVDLDCTEAFLKEREKIVVFWQGYFYDAVRRPQAKH
ncbi:MAG: hypothetical protein RR775_03150 [Massilia sp.]|uniref:hypothetical protein n=1 Tax=Massilia sp. TaxID=1882437 RepID=UPI002FC8F4DE